MPVLKRTATPARLAANRRAARHSTGPRTAGGKSVAQLSRPSIAFTLNLFRTNADVGIVTGPSNVPLTAQKSAINFFRDNRSLRLL